MEHEARGRRSRATLAALLIMVGVGACSSEPDPEAQPTAQSPSSQPSPPRPLPRAEPPTAEPPTAGPEESGFTGTVSRISPRLLSRMRFTHRPGCPVAVADLRYLRMSFVGFDGRTRIGEMVVHEDQAGPVVQVFEQLYDARWPIRRMRLVDDYGGDDDRSMADDNTSGYNCRRVAGTDRWSEHAYGRAIDLNPVENPYVTSSSVMPASGARFARIDRSPAATLPPGVIKAGDVVVSAFAGIGWGWGGEWSTSKDYQHFSSTGS